MNLNEIINELEERQLIEEMPEEYNVSRREREYSNLIGASEPHHFPPWEKYWRERPPENRNMGGFIWIPEGDIEFPDIDTKEIEGKVSEEGIESLAWYRSFHWHPPQRWGIYILDEGIYYVAQRVFRGIEQISRYGRLYNTLDLLQQSFKLLFLHEFFHFITDIATSTLEMGNMSPQQHYIQYVRNVYMNPRNSAEPIEEALANAFAYTRFQRPGIRPALRYFMKSQPNGYSAFDQYIRKDAFTQGRRELGTCIRDGTHTYGVAPLETLFDCYRRDINFSDVPIYIVNTMRLPPRYVMRSITSIPRSAFVESTTFKRDFQHLPPEIISKYEKAFNILEYNARHRSLNFEKIRGCDTVFTIRIDRNYRLSMRPINGTWELLRIAQHDEVYRNPGGY